MRRELLESRDPGTPQRAPAARSAEPRHALLLGLERSVGNVAVTRLLRNEMPPLARLPDVVHIVAKGERIEEIADSYGVTPTTSPRATRQAQAVGHEDRLQRGRGDQDPHRPLDEVQFAPLQEQGSWLEWAWDVWQSWFGDRGTPVPEPEGERPTVPSAAEERGVRDAADVIAHHNAIGTFGQAVTVNSPKRTPQRQLEILQGYCHKHEAELDAYAAATDWLTGWLDWAAFDSAGLADESAYSRSSSRSTTRVAAPTQRARTARCLWSPRGSRRPGPTSRARSGRPTLPAHLRARDGRRRRRPGQARLRPQAQRPRVRAPTGSSRSTAREPEKVEGQTAVHINFKRPVF